MRTRRYLLLSSDSVPLAEGTAEGMQRDGPIRLQLFRGGAERLSGQGMIQLLGMDVDDVPLQCHILQLEEKLVVLDPIMTLQPELRRNLRIPVQFDSFLYPLTGNWTGRRRLRSIDLSCGGLAFYADDRLEIGERAEAVVPTNTQPLVMRIQILRRQPLENDLAYYGSKFVDMHRTEEQMICETVFSIQLQNRRQS